jgi:hypothetical protein
MRFPVCTILVQRDFSEAANTYFVFDGERATRNSYAAKAAQKKK